MTIYLSCIGNQDGDEDGGQKINGLGGASAVREVKIVSGGSLEV